MSEVTADAAIEDQSSFELALAAALATQEQPQAQPEVSAPAKEPETVVAPAPTNTEQPPAPSAKELERIAALEAREAKLRDSESKAAEISKREAALATREAAATKQWDAFVADPVAHILAMRPELSPSEAAQVAEKVYFHALGDKAPPEHRARQEVTKAKTEVRSELDQLRAEVQELREARTREANSQELNAYQGELKAAAVAASEAPIVANLAKRNPDRAAELLLEVARREAYESKQRGSSEPVVLKPAEAVAKLEALLKAQRDELYGSAVEAPPQAAQSPSPTITNRDASIQPPRAPVDPLDDKALRKAALEAAGLGHLPVWD